MGRVLFKSDKNKIISILNEGGVGVMPTDTLYGLASRADDAAAVERVYQIKGRDESKPLIILISALEDLDKFGVELDMSLRDKLKQYWPGANSIILPCRSEEWSHLHRGTQTLAFRMPDDEWLQSLLELSGPLVAPSANPQAKQPARSTEEAQKYFGESVDFYVDGGTVDAAASQLYILNDGQLSTLERK